MHGNVIENSDSFISYWTEGCIECGVEPLRSIPANDTDHSTDKKMFKHHILEIPLPQYGFKDFLFLLEEHGLILDTSIETALLQLSAPSGALLEEKIVHLQEEINDHQTYNSLENLEENEH